MLHECAEGLKRRGNEMRKKKEDSVGGGRRGRKKEEMGFMAKT